jgi:hypothetical protein
LLNKSTIVFSKLQNNFDGFKILIVFLCLLKVSLSYFLPVNLITYLIHDDFLFYRLAENISQNQWLGDYQPTTLIKGFVYPAFLALAIKTQISMRILEVVLICASIYYFVSSLQRFFKPKFLLVLFAILLFYPFQYGATEFRLVRDAIYPQLLLLIFTALFFLYQRSTQKINWKQACHVLIFSVSIFLFFNTREEGVWIIPALGVFILICLGAYYRHAKLRSFCLSGVLVVLIYAALHMGLLAMNYKVYGSSITTIFKTKPYQEAYAALQRASTHRLPLDGMAHADWPAIFEVSPAAAELKPFVDGEHYAHWASIGCAAIRALNNNMALLNCDQAVPVGHFPYAFLDAVNSAGYKSLPQVLSYLDRLAQQINLACDERRITCKPYTGNVIEFELLGTPGAVRRIAELTKQALITTITYQSPSISAIAPTMEGREPYFDMKRGLHIFGLDSPYKNLQTSPKLLTADSALTVSSNGKGVVDLLLYRNGILTIGGWGLTFTQTPYSAFEVLLNDQVICSVAPDIFRPELAQINTHNLGFLCSAIVLIGLQDQPKLEVFAIDSKARTKTLIANSQAVQSSLTNTWNEACYLKANPLVNEAVLAGRMSATAHWEQYGLHEERPCAPLFNPLTSPEKPIWNAARSAEAFAVIEAIYSASSSIYHYLNLLFTISIPLFFILAWKKKSNALLILGSVFTLLLVTRIVMMAVLDFLGLAPIIPLYLMSAFYAYFILGSLSLIYLLSLKDQLKPTSQPH